MSGGRYLPHCSQACSATRCQGSRRLIARGESNLTTPWSVRTGVTRAQLGAAVDVVGDRVSMTGVATAGVTAIGVNMVAADQYLAIVLSGRMFKQRFSQMGIAPQTLSKQIEESATVTSPLIPWNSCGAYVSATLGIATLSYLPFAFFNWINPLVSIAYALLGLQIHRVEPEGEPASGPQQARVYGIGAQGTEPPRGVTSPD